MNISDTHNDFLTKLSNTKSVQYLKACERHGVKNLLASVFTSEYSTQQAKNKIQNAHRLLKSYGNNNFKMHIEDLGYIKSNKDICLLRSQSPFSCSLTWNSDNQFAGGNFGIKPLTKNGIALAKLLEQNGITIDTAHLNQKSFAKIAKLTQRPIFCSHTGLCTIKRSPRNLTNSQAQTIIDSNGYFGLFLSPTFMTTNGTMNCNTFATIIYKTLAKFGDNNFGIGSDFFGIGKPKGNLQTYHDFEQVAQILRDMGVGQTTIEKIFYKNFENRILNAN